MSVLRRVKLRTPDGVESIEYPLGVEAENVEVANQENLSQRLVRIDEDLKKRREDITIINEIAGTNKQNIGAAEVRIDALERRSASVDKKPYYFNTVADMKAYQKLIEGDMAITLGYYTVNDGGRAEYSIIKDNTLVDDGGSIHDLNNGLKAKLIIENNQFNIAQWGAKPNTDCKEVVQKCINYSANTGTIMIVPKGETYLVYSLTLTPGVQIDGQGAIFKKPNLSAPPYNMTPAQMKWIHMFSSGGSDLTTENSKLVEFKNLTLDGNALEMWDPSQGYAQEQASLMILGKNSSTESARWKINIDNCIFKNNVSDGIHVWINTEVNITNCRSENCFRGGLVVTGGNSIINANNFTCVSTVEGMPDGIDIEVDSKGALDLKRIYVNLKNFIIDADFDIGVPGDNGYINVENSQLLRKSFIVTAKGEGAVQSFKNCYFHNTDTSSWTIQFVSPINTKVSFDNCTFNGTITEDENHNFSSNQTVKILSVYEAADYSTTPHSQCIFTKCKFMNMKTVSGTLSHLIDVIFENCDFMETVVGTSAIGQGINNVAFAPNTLTLTNNRFYNNRGWLTCRCSLEPCTKIFLANNKILSPGNTGIYIHAPYIFFNNEVYENGYQIGLSNGANPRYRGHRTIVGDELLQPSGTIRFINEVDTFQLNDHSQTYRRHNGQWIEEFPST